MTATSTDQVLDEIEAVRQLGTTSQRERYAAGLLPEDELLALVRPELFKPFNDFKRWKPFRAKGKGSNETGVKEHEIIHGHGCTKSVPIEFETCQADELHHDEWEVYRQFQVARDLAANHPWLDSSSVTIEPLAHFGTCPECKSEASRMSVRATIAWAGRKLLREFVLT